MYVEGTFVIFNYFLLTINSKEQNSTSLSLQRTCGGVYNVQRQIPTEIPIGLCTHFIGICLGLGVGQCECTIIIKGKERKPTHSKSRKTDVISTKFILNNINLKLLWRKRNLLLRNGNHRVMRNADHVPVFQEVVIDFGNHRIMTSTIQTHNVISQPATLLRSNFPQ